MDTAITYNEILFSALKKKRRKSYYLLHMGGPGRHAKWNKSITEGQIMNASSYMKHQNNQM